LFFIKTSYQPSITGADHVADQTKETTQKQPVHVNTETSKLFDKATKEGIGYANIYLKNTAKGVATNAIGEFIFNISGAKPADQVILSSVGYESDTVTVQELNERKEFFLKPKAYQLMEVEIRSKPLTAREIVKSAEKRIGDNYYRDIHQQEFFYRVSSYVEDSLVENEEAAVLVYDPEGYQSKGNVTRRLKGEILQFRKTTANRTRNLWEGVGSLWLMYTHDTVLDKDNVLHRSNYYDLNLIGIVAFEDKRVYEIAFECRRPGAYTTGFGYPSPLSAKGKIYIEVGSFAVLRVETLIYRKPYQLKKAPHITREPYGYQLIQTYKQVSGKYFLNYSRQVHFQKVIDTKMNSSYRTVSVREQLSTEIDLAQPSPLTRPIMSIKAATVKEDADFWKTHNTVIQDDIVGLLKLATKE
jgi:hypothetical protein